MRVGSTSAHLNLVHVILSPRINEIISRKLVFQCKNDLVRLGFQKKNNITWQLLSNFFAHQKYELLLTSIQFARFASIIGTFITFRPDV